MFFFKITRAAWKIINFICLFLCIVFLLALIITFINTDGAAAAADKAVRTQFAVTSFISYLGYRFAKRQIRLCTSCQSYKNILPSNYIGSIEELSAAANQPNEEAQKNIKGLQSKKLLTALNFASEDDIEEDDYEDEPEVKMTVKCLNCGANNIIMSKLGGSCEYCGSHLTLLRSGQHKQLK